MSERLQPRQQFWWGALGGFIIVLGQFGAYVGKVPQSASWPKFGSYYIVIHLLMWLLFPVAAGIAASLCDSEYRLIAAYEGAAFPSFFFYFAQDLPGVWGLH